MYPRSRMPPPRNQISNNLPMTLGFNQYPITPGSGIRGAGRGSGFRMPGPGPGGQGGQWRHEQPGPSSHKKKGTRLRPRNPAGNSFYSDDSNSNYSNSTTGSRGGYNKFAAHGSNGGYGVVNAAMRNLPPQNTRPPQEIRDQNRPNQNQSKTRKLQNDEISISSDRRSSSRLSELEEEAHKMYFCPKCGENYAFRASGQNRYIGKIPLILQCHHTVCQECIYKNLKDHKVSCPICSNDSILTEDQNPVCHTDMQQYFAPNYHIIGVIVYHRPIGGYLGNLENIRLISSSCKKQQTLPAPTERCCFGSCLKEATMYCPSCEGIYCADCCTVVHKSVKNLMTHEPVPRHKQKFSLALARCSEHPQLNEFFCKTCDLNACCYCVLEKHTDHERVPLYLLNDAEKEEVKKLKKQAEKAMKELLVSQRKAEKIANFNTDSVRKDICQYFGDLHAKVYWTEKKLYENLENVKRSDSGLDGVLVELKKYLEEIKQLVAFNENAIGDKRLNVRLALDKLRNVKNLPRFLSIATSEPVKFLVDNKAVASFFEDEFAIEKSEETEIRLLTEEELPENYSLDIESSDEEIEETMSALMASTKTKLSEEAKSAKLESLKMVPVNGNSLKTAQKHTRPSLYKKLEMEKVEVQHINSMDSIFIQFKKDLSKLLHLNNEIENYVKMNGYEPLDHPQLHNLYLVLYLTESQNAGPKEHKWCRARITEIKNGENGPLYETFFIDYGKTQTVDGNRIREIPACFIQKKPFAIECMLYNPMSVNWNKTAHMSLAKILNGKEVFMLEKSINAGIHEVDLMILSSDGSITSVTDILVHAKNAVAPINDDVHSIDGSVCSRKEGYFHQLKVFPNSKKFTKNQKEKVVIANVIDPFNVFVHSVVHQESFKSMNAAIKKAYKHSKGNGCIPIEGTYVLVEHKDALRSNWHRAFIKSVDLNSDKVQALLVDWGVNVVVPTSSVRPLQEAFTKLESQAIFVKLAQVVPYNKQPTWSQQAVNFLQRYHKSQDVLKMIVFENEPDVQVALFDISGQVDLCLNALMVENNLADSTGPMSKKLEWPQYTIENPEFSEESLMDSLLKKVDEQEHDDADSEEEDLSDVKKRQVDVIKVESPDLLWVKFLEFREREESMHKDLQIHYSVEQPTKFSWKAGDACVVALHNEFTRGKVLGKVGDNSYKINLFDKVQVITLPLERIFVYDKYFMKYPQAVYKGHLANIKPAGDTGKWSSSSVEALQKICTEQKKIFANKAPEIDELHTKVGLPLDMWYGKVIQGGPLDPDRIKYVSINNFLVKLGLAYKVPRPQPIPVTTAKNGDELLKVEKMLTGEKNKEKSSDEKTEDKDKSDDKSAKEKTDDKPEISEKLKSEKNVENLQIIEEKSLEKTAKSVAESALSSIVEEPEKSKSQEAPQTKSKKDKKTSTIRILTKDEKLNTEEDKGTQADLEQPPLNYTSKNPSNNENFRTLRNKEKNTSTEDLEFEDGGDSQDESPRTSRNHADSPVKSWNALVEEELGDAVSAVSKETSKEKGGVLKGVSCSEDDPEQEEGSPYHKSEVFIADWLPPFRLGERDFQGRVTCVETGGHLYLHTEAMDVVYYKMEANIKEYFENNPPSVVDFNWQPGHLCTIKYEDGNWYRGKVLKVKSPKEISVFMIDFGSDHDVAPDVLFREVLYTDINGFATKVKLDKVYAKSGAWLSSDYDQFHELVTDWCRIVVKGPVDVELPLVDVYNEKGVYVNQKLTELCPNLSRSSNFPVDQNLDAEECVIIESIETEVPFAEEMLMDNLDQELDYPRLASPLPESVKLNSSNLKYQSRPLPEEFAIGKKMLLEIGGIMNYDKVALKLPGESPSEELYDLVIDIQDAADSLPLLKDPKVGTPCIAPFSEDGVWYRAIVSGTSAVGSGFVDVFFVDYGNSEAVTTENVKEIKPEYMKLPQQTWEAYLNLFLKQDADVITVMQVMNSLDRKKRYVKLVKEEPLMVDLYDKHDNLCYQSLIDSESICPLQTDEDI